MRNASNTTGTRLHGAAKDSYPTTSDTETVPSLSILEYQLRNLTLAGHDFPPLAGLTCTRLSFEHLLGTPSDKRQRMVAGATVDSPRLATADQRATFLRGLLGLEQTRRLADLCQG
jgi:hypothetical protein